MRLSPLNKKGDNRMIGIYKITNLVDGNAYIGQSIQIEERFKEHQIGTVKLIKNYIKHLQILV